MLRSPPLLGASSTEPTRHYIQSFPCQCFLFGRSHFSAVPRISAQHHDHGVHLFLVTPTANPSHASPCSCVLIYGVFAWVCGMASFTSPWITVGERERTRALSGEIFYLSTSFAASAVSAGASVSAPQVTPMCESSLSLFPPLYNFACLLIFKYIYKCMCIKMCRGKHVIR